MSIKGRIIPNGVILKEHEYATVVFLTENGYNIELIPRSNTEGIHTPDILMSGYEWEMKAPKGKGKWLIKNTIQKALQQSQNIIIDLRRIKLPQQKCISEIERQFNYSKRILRLMVITKSKKLLEYSK